MIDFEQKGARSPFVRKSITSGPMNNLTVGGSLTLKIIHFDIYDHISSSKWRGVTSLRKIRAQNRNFQF